jgi:hypothetical protein
MDVAIESAPLDPARRSLEKGQEGDCDAYLNIRVCWRGPMRERSPTRQAYSTECDLSVLAKTQLVFPVIIGSVLPGAALGEKMAAKSVKRSNDMSSTILATRTIVILGFALLIGSPALAGNKVQVCHVPPGNPENAHEISISENATKAHLRNHEGDTLGACPEAVACPCWTEADLNGALEAAAADPDVMVESCGMSVYAAGSEFEAHLALAAELGYAIGYAYFGDNDGMCAVFVENGIGLEPIEVEGLSIEEAGECARIIGEICPGLLP